MTFQTLTTLVSLESHSFLSDKNKLLKKVFSLNFWSLYINCSSFSISVFIEYKPGTPHIPLYDPNSKASFFRELFLWVLTLLPSSPSIWPYSPFTAFTINNACSPLSLLFTLRSLSPLKHTHLLWRQGCFRLCVFLPTPCTVPSTQQAFNTSLLNECVNNFMAWMFKFLS